MFTERFIARFWSHIHIKSTSECWEWLNYRTKRGYGQVYIFALKKTLYSPRVAWWLFNGDPGTSCVLHRCDNPTCCNPNHLFLGTRTDNHKDMMSKKRQVPGISLGETHGLSKLTNKQVTEIRKKLDNGEMGVVLANKYSVSKSVISNIKHRKTWKHLGG